MSATILPVNSPKFGSRSYMQDLRRHFQNDENLHDFYAAPAMKIVSFDGGFESFARLDQFFQAFKKQIGKLPKNFEKDPRILNTVCLIASYIGQFICQKLDIEENWTVFDELKIHFPNFQSSAYQFYYSYGLIGHNQLFLPLAYIYQHFFAQKTPFTISQNIETSILNARITINESQQQFTEQMHDIQTMYANRYDLFCGLAFKELIRQADLDYSLASLDRLDDMMNEIRNKHVTSKQKFLKETKNFYFFLFLTGYIGQVIAQHAYTSLRWFSPAQVSRMIKQEISHDISTCRIAQINNSIFFISQHVNQCLFDPEAKKSTYAYSQEILAILKPRTIPYYLAQNAANQPINVAQSPYYAALYRAGQLASYVLLHIHGIQPRLSRDEKTKPVTLPPGNSYLCHAKTPIEELQKQLLINKENFAYNVLAYETHACLPHLYTDAISLNIYNYGQNPMNIHLMIPFFQAFDYRGFCILQPYFAAMDLPTHKKIAQIAPVMGAFFKGLEDSEYGRPESYQIWKNHYQPHRWDYPESLYKHTLAMNP